MTASSGGTESRRAGMSARACERRLIGPGDAVSIVTHSSWFVRQCRRGAGLGTPACACRRSPAPLLATKTSWIPAHVRRPKYRRCGCSRARHRAELFKGKMSGFERHLQTALEGVNPRWAREFGDLIRAEEIRAGLKRLQKAGGDPNFALFTLTDCRWRRIKPLPAPRERNRFRRALRLLLEGQGEWPDRLRTLGGKEWKEIEPVLRQALTNLESFHPVEESVFKTSGTRYEYETPSLHSDRATTCLLVLHGHVGQATGRRRTNRVLLGSLMDGFGLIKRSRTAPSGDSARWGEKRLERAAKKDEHGHSPREFAG